MHLMLTESLPLQRLAARLRCERGHSLILAAVLLWAPALTLAASSASPRERILFNAGWFFTKGDSVGTGTNLAYEALKPWPMKPSSTAYGTRTYARCS